MDATFWLVAGIGFLWGIKSLSETGANTTRIERKLDLILKHLNINPDQDVNARIMDLLKAGQKIQAIKLYREQTGVGLKEAKDYVERL